MDEMKRFLAVTILMVGTLGIGMAANELSREAAGGHYTVAELMNALPVDSQVVVTANVSTVAEDYVSDSGNTYQQFYVTNGEKEVLVFCGTFNGRVEVTAGDRVRVAGTFQKYYDKYEIYTECASITPIT